jgi:hypothetical protein
VRRAGVAGRLQTVAVRGHQRGVNHGDGVAARIAARSADGRHLFQKHVTDARLLRQFAAGGVGQILVFTDVAARQSPAIKERREAAAHQQHPEP